MTSSVWLEYYVEHLICDICSLKIKTLPKQTQGNFQTNTTFQSEQVVLKLYDSSLNLRYFPIEISLKEILDGNSLRNSSEANFPAKERNIGEFSLRNA